MLTVIKTLIKAVPLLTGLLRGRTPDHGKTIVKSGVASLTIAGLISAGKLSASGLDSTLLLILSILEAIGYLYGAVAISSGASQTHPVDQLLGGRAEGLSDKQAKASGRQWLAQIQQNQNYKLPGSSLFDEDYSDLDLKAEDISQVSNPNPKKEKP